MACGAHHSQGLQHYEIQRLCHWENQWPAWARLPVRQVPPMQQAHDVLSYCGRHGCNTDRVLSSDPTIPAGTGRTAWMRAQQTHPVQVGDGAERVQDQPDQGEHPHGTPRAGRLLL